MGSGVTPVNHVLSRLPEPELTRLMGLARHVEHPAAEGLSAPGEPIDTLYFPLSGMVSIVSADASGAAVEVVTIGREGIVGVTALFGSPAIPFAALWQLPGQALAIDLGDLRAILGELPTLMQASAAYLGSLLIQSGQNVACNRIHDMEERAAKWRLLTQDRVVGDRIELTQEFFATMLGVTRPKLSLVESTLRRAGLVSARRRGSLVILDRAGLEEQSCECYEVISAELRRFQEQG